jgi:hypothetical protein
MVLDLIRPQIFGYVLAHLPVFEVADPTDLARPRGDWYWLRIPQARDGMLYLPQKTKLTRGYITLTREEVAFHLRGTLRSAPKLRFGLALVTCPGRPVGLALFLYRPPPPTPMQGEAEALALMTAEGVAELDAGNMVDMETLQSEIREVPLA